MVSNPYINFYSSVQRMLQILLLVNFWACNAITEIGNEEFIEENFTIEVVDSFGLDVSTILIDSLATHNTERLLVGYHQNATTGQLKASTFFELNLDESSPIIPEENVQFDSLILVLDYDQYYYFDTTQLMQIAVHELTEELVLEEDTDALYNNSSATISEHPIAKTSFYPRPGTKPSLSIRLPDELGQLLLQKAIDREEELENNERFQDFLKGFALIPSTDYSGAIVGFSRTSQLRLHYSLFEKIPKSSEVKTFSIEENDNGFFLFFNQIKSNTANTTLESLTNDEDEIASEATMDQSFIQAGAGWSIKISIPHIRSLLQIDESFILANAVLKLQPITSDFEAQFLLPEILSVFWIDKDNEIISQNANPAFLNLDTAYGRDTEYRIDIKDFIENQLASAELEDYSLLVTLNTPALNSAVNQIIIGNANHKQKMELTLQLIDIKK